MELLTPDELSLLLRVTKRSVYELCSARKQTQPHPLPYLKIANKLRFNKDSITRWLEEQEQAA